MGEIDKLFGPVQKLYLKPDGSTEWAEVEPVKDSITLGEMKNEYKEFEGSRLGCFELSFKLHSFKKKDRVKIGQFIGLLKRPKCTYKTIKRDCAKRNRRW